MRTLFALLALLSATAFAAPTPPAHIEFDGDTYAFAARAADAARISEHYLRVGETIERFSRLLTVADMPQAASAKATAIGVAKFASLRTPGLKPETFVDEANPEHDISVSWYDLTDDHAAVQYHVARFVDLPKGGVREYHFTLRAYVNKGEPDATLAALHAERLSLTLGDVARLAALDRAPQRPPADPKPKTKP